MEGYQNQQKSMKVVTLFAGHVLRIKIKLKKVTSQNQLNFKQNVDGHVQLTMQKGQLSRLRTLSQAFLEHVKIIFIPVIALSFPHFCPKSEQTLHIHQGQHS